MAQFESSKDSPSAPAGDFGETSGAIRAGGGLTRFILFAGMLGVLAIVSVSGMVVAFRDRLLWDRPHRNQPLPSESAIRAFEREYAPASASRTESREVSLRTQLSKDGRRLSLVSPGGDTLLLELSNKSDWHAIVRNPFVSFVTRTEPFSPPHFAQSEQSLVDARQGEVLRSFEVSDLPRFSFFSATPTTVGAVSGAVNAERNEVTLHFVFVDVATGRSTVITNFEAAFPRWLDRSVWPPSYGITRYLTLGRQHPALGASILEQCMSFQGGVYVADEFACREAVATEFARAKLSTAHDKLLRTQPLAQLSSSDEGRAAVQTLIRLIVYGKFLGKEVPLAALIERFHPTLRQAIQANSELRVRVKTP